MVFVLGALLAVVTLFMGWLGWRGTHTSRDYLIAGRSVRPSVMGLSYGVTLASPAMILGLVSLGGGPGPDFLGPVLLGLLLGLVLAFVFVGRRTAALGAALDSQTWPELLAQRYQSVGLRTFTGLIIFLAAAAVAAAVLTDVARWLSGATGIPQVFLVLGIALVVALVVVLGGLKGVMYNHVFQAALVVAVLAAAALVTWLVLGQLGAARRPLASLNHLSPHHPQVNGWLVWTFFPWTLTAGLVGGLMLGLAAQPQLALRFLTVRRSRRVTGAFFWAAAFILVMVGAAWALGNWSGQIYWAKIGQAAEGIAPAPGLNLLPVQGPDVLAVVMDRFLPGWIKVLLGLGLSVAALAVLSSLVHLAGVSLGRDVLAHVWRRHVRGGHAMVLLARFGAALSVIAAVLWARWLPGPVLNMAAWSFVSLAAIAWLPAYGLGLYWRGMTRAGAWSSLLVGLSVWLLHLLFVGARTAPAIGLCQWLLDRPTVLADLGPRALGWSWWSGDLGVLLRPLVEPVSGWWRLQFVNPIPLLLPLSLVTAVAVSQLTRRPDSDHLDRCWRAFRRGPRRGSLSA